MSQQTDHRSLANIRASSCDSYIIKVYHEKLMASEHRSNKVIHALHILALSIFDFHLSFDCWGKLSLFSTQMCYILLSACQTCAFPLRTRHERCSHAELHSFDPLDCPNRMKRRRQSNTGTCGKCNHRKGSLSSLPADDIYFKDKSGMKRAIVMQTEGCIRSKSE